MSEAEDGSHDAEWRCARCGARNPPAASQCLYCGRTWANEDQPAQSGPRRGKNRPDLGALIVLGVCAVLLLAFSLHAYVAKTMSPWGRELSNPIWFAIMLVLGVGISSWLLLHPTRAWPLWARGCGLAGLLLLSTGALTFWHALFRSEDRRPSEVKAYCLAHVKSLSLALSAYAAENGTFPTAEDWRDRIEDYVKNTDVYHCPNAEGLNCAFAYNAALAGVMYSALDDPARTVLLFESDAATNAPAGGPGFLPAEPRHFGGDNYGFADGSARWLPRKRNPDGTWAKAPDAEVTWEVGMVEEQDVRQPTEP